MFIYVNQNACAVIVNVDVTRQIHHPIIHRGYHVNYFESLEFKKTTLPRKLSAGKRIFI